MEKKCCICGKEFIGMGNNPEPIMEGCCCETCNAKFVIPIRIFTLKRKLDNFEIVKNMGEFPKLKEKLKEKNFELSNSLPFILIYENSKNEETVCVLIAD